MNFKKILRWIAYFYLAMSALAGLILTFIEGGSDIRALGRFENNAFMPIVQVDTLVGVFRSLNFIILIICLVSLLLVKNDRKDYVSAARWSLGAFFFLSTVGKFAALIVDNASMALFMVFATLLSYILALVFTGLASAHTKENDFGISVVLFLIAASSLAAVFAFLFLGVGQRFFFTFFARILFFVMYAQLIIIFSRRIFSKSVHESETE